MTFELPDHWVWDCWLADDGQTYHLFYLHAPRSLGDPDARHRNARIGHATSLDLHSWTDHGRIFDAGDQGSFDASATWTGCVVHDGTQWVMFYTGARFLEAGSHANIEAIGRATSPDCFTWTKQPGTVRTADPTWYETLRTAGWHEEAWRDPWVYYNEADASWHMFVTARANSGDARDRGVIGHAVSPDLLTWHTRPPLSHPGAGFAHLEVLQRFDFAGQRFLLFSCDSAHLAGARTGKTGGIWIVNITGLQPPYPIAEAKLLCDERLYAGRLVMGRRGAPCLLAFENAREGAAFGGRISDPIILRLVRDEDTGTTTLSMEARP